MTGNPFLDLVNGGFTQKTLKRSEFAERYFLNPRIPRAIENDLDGSRHFKLQITDPQGTALPGLRKNDLIPLYTRYYQNDIIDSDHKRIVVRYGRRTGKTFSLAVLVAVEAIQNPNAKILVLTPNESHIKVLFDDYIRPLFAAYRHRKSGTIGLIKDPNGNVPNGHDLVMIKDTQKPQEIVLSNGVTIRGMVISPSARGQSASLVIFDEADHAKTEDVQAIVSPILMTEPETRIVMSSTPLGRRDSFFYNACHDSDWNRLHRTFEVLPHYDKEMRAQMAKMSGGESTNAFKQEYLAEFGEQTEGVFDQAALNKAFIVSPYVRVLEKFNPETSERIPLLADTTTDPTRQTQAFYEAIKPMDWNVPYNNIGSQSLYRPEYVGHGVVTAGTDWNEVAGMQTILTWWPPEKWLKEGRLHVSRFAYNKDEPITTDRAKNAHGDPRHFVIGHHNGDPGGVHDLSHVKGIVIWHGRLESGYFNWQSAANRVIGLMSIPNFINSWYVDYGYGEQVNKMIEGIMASGQYMPDGGNMLHRAYDIPDPMLRLIRLFHPENDPEVTGRMYKTIRFGDRYKSTDIDYTRRDDLYKDVMVGLSKRMINGREILLPYGELTGYYDPEDLGSQYENVLDTATGKMVEVATAIVDNDKISENGGTNPEGDRSIGGLITQMREWRVAGYSPNGRPRYEGIDHTIDAAMLSWLCWWENYSTEGPGNMFRAHTTLETDFADQLWQIDPELANAFKAPNTKMSMQDHGAGFNMKNYKDELAPLRAIQQGKMKPEQAGHSLKEMLGRANKYLNRK